MPLQAQGKYASVPQLLICDDAVAFSVLFTRWMRDCDVEVIGPARTAEEALAMAGEQRPEIIVVDHLLPDATSAELVPRLREALPDARILLISSLPEQQLAEAAAEIDVDARITKAARPEELCAAVQALLDQPR